MGSESISIGHGQGMVPTGAHPAIKDEPVVVESVVIPVVEEEKPIEEIQTVFGNKKNRKKEE